MATEAALPRGQIPKAVDCLRRDLFAVACARGNPREVMSSRNLGGPQANYHLAFAIIAAEGESLLGL